MASAAPIRPRVGDQTPRQRATRRFFGHKAAMVGGFVLMIILLAALLANLIAPDPNAVDLLNARTGPSAAHILGADALGRDVLARLLHGARVSLLVGVLAVSIYIVIGSLLGAAAGYYGGLLTTGAS